MTKAVLKQSLRYRDLLTDDNFVRYMATYVSALIAIKSFQF